MIEVHNLTKQFGSITAVDNVSFKVEAGTVLGFLGPNGAGKSTTMKMITGFLHPTSGRAKVAGFDVTESPLEAKKRLGYLPEGAPLYPDMTPAGFLEFIAEIRGLSGGAKKARVAEVVAKVQLDGVLHQRIDTLSKGFKRRVGLAQAILHDPQVLILDEPTDGLDPNQKHEVRELIRAMARDKVIVLSTHILEEVEAVCTRVMIIARGKVVIDCKPSELVARSRMHNAVRLTIKKAKADDVIRRVGSLAGVAGVDEIDSQNGCVTVLVRPEPKAAIAPEISARAREERWEIDEFHVEHGRLDEVFRDLTLGHAKR